jgi:cytochrome c biogenesis protein CcdA
MCVILFLYASVEANERPVLEYFYENYCESCNPAADFEAEFKELTGKPISEYKFESFNAAKSAGKAKLAEAIDRYGLSADDVRLPMAIVDGVAYMGGSQIRKDLPAYAIDRAGTSDSTMYYLYVTACESCSRAKGIIDSLPKCAVVTIGDYSFESELSIHAVDIGADAGLAFALFEAFNVPEDKQLAPIVFIGGRYYQGAESIERFLAHAIARGEGLRTPIITVDAPLPALGWGPTVVAGFSGGLTPCALSMLILFLSIIANLKKNAGISAAIFLGSKFAVYLLIGTVLLTLFQAWNPAWLPTASKALLTAISAALIALNLRDAWMARRDRYGDIRNQLPIALRKGLQSRIRSALSEKKGSFLLIIGLGIIVAAGEFLCSGQVYLAALLTALQKDRDAARLMGLLVTYCLAFLVPSAALCFLVIRGRSALELSEFMRRNMMAVKLVTALFFAAVLAIVWFL